MTTTAVRRWRSVRWWLLGIAAIVGVAVVTTLLTAPRPGGYLDPASTSSDGTHALVTLLREHGVEVVEAGDIGAVQRAARPDTLIVVGQTFHLGDDQLRRLAELPGDRLLIEPLSSTREILAPEIERDGSVAQLGGTDPGCELPEAQRAGAVKFGGSDAYQGKDDVDVTRCYGGALVRYRADGRDVTVLGTSDVLVNSGLLEEGNAALAMNLAGTRPRLVWYAPQRSEGGETGATASIFDLIPEQVTWVVYQLGLVVVLLAVWQGRRLGPLVAEQLPVVVRASETVEGRGRLYRSRRARDRAADALRTAALQRMLPRLGLGRNAAQPAVVQAAAERSGRDPQSVGSALFGPAPATDSDLLELAHDLDDIERQVAQS